MASHDAGKLEKNPADRRTMTRDPNAPGGAIIENGSSKDRDGNNTTIAGSSHITTNIDGKWYVCNTRGEPFDMESPYDTESEAVEAAQEKNKDNGAPKS